MRAGGARSRDRAHASRPTSRGGAAADGRATGSGVVDPGSGAGARQQTRRNTSGGRRACVSAAGPLVVAIAASAAVVLLTGASPVLRGRTTAEITRITALGPHAGDCDRCHSMHSDEGTPQPHALLGPDDNTLCASCHTIAWEGGSYPGTELYAGSAHGGSPNAVWPGPDPPARTEPDAAGKCVNCHDPHGWQDASGLIPMLALAREEGLCLTCHDGYPAATDIRSDLLQPYRHPTLDYSGRHTGPLESSPSDFGITPLNRRHAECSDCHNPHVARHDALPVTPPDASKRLLGVSRVAVLNGTAGSAPVYTFIPGSDTLTAPVTEYQLCFKCHSSWTTQPPGQTDLARVLNPNNPSYHPVEAAGNDLTLDPLSFEPGWGPTSIVACDDCHGSDLGTNRGPHGSAYPAILRAPYTASPGPHTSTSDELCFRCHAYAVYGTTASDATTRARSRFNAPGAGMGHAEHVAGESVPCYACHVTHGSSNQPSLLVTGRVPGITSYTRTATGGTCMPTCHGSESYTVNYAR